MKGHKFQSPIFGLSVGIFRNFRDCFWTVRAKFRDYFRTVQAKILGLFADSPDRIFGTIFGQSWTVLRFGFDPRIDVFRFCGVFWYPNNSVMNREWTKRCPIFYGSEIWAIVCVIVGKFNNMLLCVNFFNICMLKYINMNCC